MLCAFHRQHQVKIISSYLLCLNSNRLWYFPFAHIFVVVVYLSLESHLPAIYYHPNSLMWLLFFVAISCEMRAYKTQSDQRALFLPQPHKHQYLQNSLAFLITGISVLWTSRVQNNFKVQAMQPGEFRSVDDLIHKDRCMSFCKGFSVFSCQANICLQKFRHRRAVEIQYLLLHKKLWCILAMYTCMYILKLHRYDQTLGSVVKCYVYTRRNLSETSSKCRKAHIFQYSATKE